MNSTDKLHQARLNEWATKISEQVASGLTAREWCTRNNITIHKYNYWKHLLKEEAVNQLLPDVAPLSVPDIVPLAIPDIPSGTNHHVYPESSHSTNCTIRAIDPSAVAKISIGNISIEISSSISEDFLVRLIKAVRYA